MDPFLHDRIIFVQYTVCQYEQLEKNKKKSINRAKEEEGSGESIVEKTYTYTKLYMNHPHPLLLYFIN